MKTEVTRTRGHAGIGPERSPRKLGEDLVAAPFDLVARDDQKAPQSFHSLRHLLVA